MQLRHQCTAFRRGLDDLINREWMQLFDSSELQLLISGIGDASIDLLDLRQHVTYAGIYHENHPTIRAFWNVVQTFSDNEVRALIKVRNARISRGQRECF